MEKVARVWHEPAPQCATFDPIRGGRVLTTLTVTRASDGACVLRTAALESWELRETLPWVHQQYPRGEGWAITLDAKVVST